MPNVNDDSPKNEYKGAAHLHEDAEAALRTLVTCLSVETTECETHSVLRVAGFGTPKTLQATAIYLVASVAQCVHADLQIRAALFDDATRANDLLADIEDVIRDDKCGERFKTITRDPWLWEGISHLVIHLASSISAFHPPGTVLAKIQPKYDVNDHGLDLIAIYDCGSLGITAGESKAYLDDPARAVGDASKRLSEIDQNLRDIELRAAVTQLRPSLSPKQQQMLGRAFWREERTYYPFVCCDESATMDWSKKRQALGNLNVSSSRKLLVPFPLHQARQVFDQISSLMRDYAADRLTL